MTKKFSKIVVDGLNKGVMKTVAKSRCKIHGSPMFGALDPFGNSTWFYCRACDEVKKAKRFYQLAGQQMEKGNETKCTIYTEKAQQAEQEAQMLSGRWFDCKVNGEGWDMSEHQIERVKAEGNRVEVISEIV